MQTRKHTLADVRLAAMKLLLLPDTLDDFTESELELIRSDLAGELLEGEYRAVLDSVWVGRDDHNGRN